MKTLVSGIFPCILLLIFLSACGSEKDQLKAENDSLRFKLEVGSKAVVAMQEISVLIDSIDAARNILRLEMIEGIQYQNYTERMGKVLEYVKKSQEKINLLEEDLKLLNDTASAYVMMIGALQSELALATSQIEELRLRVEKVEKKNTELVSLVQLQRTELEDNHLKIEASKYELKLFENRIHELMIQSEVNEADAYYARAEAVYEAAKRTKLAPRKKKETLKEALELYKKASSLGNKKAQTKITELERRI